MKKTILFFSTISIFSFAEAQIDVNGILLNRANQRAEEGVNKGLDAAEDGAKNASKKKDKDKKDKSKDNNNNADNANPDNNNAGNNSNSATPQADLQTYSKFDFVPGDQVVYFEDFSQDAIGDFPDKWNTNSGGEVVTVGTATNKWLKCSQAASYSPQIKTPFPDNFTIEYDLLLRQTEGKGDPIFAFQIYSADKENLVDLIIGNSGTSIEQGSNWVLSKWSNPDDYAKVGESNTVTPESIFNKVSKISIWVQKERLRMYVNQTKVLDLPKALPAGNKYNYIRFQDAPQNDPTIPVGDILFSNLRIAIGAPDMRNKLITDGKLVTRGILFDVNSDKIKPESYGTLKEIAQVLKENAGIKVKIFGHTDSDGDDKANLDLSKRRAASVKSSLAKDFGIDVSRMETDGKGESEPASLNTTSEGKANNRRVEFIKM